MMIRIMIVYVMMLLCFSCKENRINLVKEKPDKIPNEKEILEVKSNTKKGQTMKPIQLTRGLESAIIDRTSLEQKLARTIAEKLKERGYPIDQVSKVYLDKEIVTDTDFYGYNEIIFFINPLVYEHGARVYPEINIGVGWEDPSIIRTANGGMEFQVGKKIKKEDLIMYPYRLQDTYNTPLKNQDEIITKIDEIFLNSSSKMINWNTSNEDVKGDYDFLADGLQEIIKCNLVLIEKSKTRDHLYTLNIRKMESQCSEEINISYTFEIDIKTSVIKVLDVYYPGLYPTPAVDNFPPPSPPQHPK